MTRRLSLLLACALLVGATACKGDDTRAKFAKPTSTTSSTSTTVTTSTTVAAPTTTAAKAASTYVPAPGGCDPSTLARVEPRADRTRYKIDAVLDMGAGRVSGTWKATFTPDRATDQMFLRLWANGPTPARDGGHIDISNVRINGRSIDVGLDNATTAVTNNEVDLAANKAVEITLTFTTKLPGVSQDRLTQFGNVVRLGSWFPLLPWEPIGFGGVGGVWNLEPPTTSYAEAWATPAADFDVRLDIPAGLDILASGVQGGDGRWTATAVPDWAASIGKFTIVRGQAGSVPAIVGVEESVNESANAYLAKVVSSMNALAQRYGPYPYPQYSLAITPNLRGGIEYPGHVMQGPNSNARTTPHEVAHMWFYSLVGSNQGRDPWLDEGLATWGEAMANGTYASFKSRTIPSDGKNRLGEPMTFWDQHNGSYYRSVYVQGLQALGALGVSTAAVDCALARYVASNAYRVATPAALTAALSTVAPNAADVLRGFGVQRVTASGA